ncbi:MAG: ATP-binding protein [Oscillibacter sp.]|nr:ATP-binding protein [Oscillibacter sp.]
MNLFDKERYTFADIQYLIDNGVEESIHLDFKAAGALAKDDKKKNEIAKDVSAFANSDGGIIIYGISEIGHKADSYSFVDGDVFTKEWLEQIINSNIQKRINNIRIIPLRQDGDINRTVYIVKIPRSNNAPHMSGDKRYYKRYNFQSVMMEEYEVRDLFYRHNTSTLSIVGWFLFDNGETADGRFRKYSFVVQVHNESQVTESLYKLNCYINNPYVSRYNVRWRLNQGRIDTTELYEDRLKISDMGTLPLFPNEAIDMMRIYIEVPVSKVRSFVEETKIELVLFYDNAEDTRHFYVRDYIYS